MLLQWKLSASIRPLNSKISLTEPFARFIVSKKHFSKVAGTTKGRAFEPAPEDNATSVFRSLSLTEEQIWWLGQTHVATPRKMTLYARADIPVNSVLTLELTVRSDEPPRRHAIIGGWPAEKDAVMSLAQELAAEATLVVYDDKQEQL